MNEVKDKLKEVLFSVLPITTIVFILHFTISPLDPKLIYLFLVGSIMVIVGLTVFLIGIDQGIENIGRGVGNVIARSNSYCIAITVSLILGFFISFAEPDLHILAKQVSSVTDGKFNNMLMVTLVSIGIGVMMTVGMIRSLKNIKIKYILTFSYLLIFVLSFFSNYNFIAIAFDASGATTGAITVPFMLALASGISSMKKDSKVNEDTSFGVIGISSTGAIIGILIAGIFFRNDVIEGSLPENSIGSTDIGSMFLKNLIHIAYETSLTLLPIVFTYAIIQIFFLKQRKNRVIGVVSGIVMTYVGLVVFLLGINSGFMEIGIQLGIKLSGLDSRTPILIVSLLLGVTTVLAEPAVHVLKHQVEDVTGGSVRREWVLIFLSSAVGLAILLSSLRIMVDWIELWMYLIPGFGFAIILSYFVPELFVGMAIDAGGVASGPMTATFSLAFIQGISAGMPNADIIRDGFGMIAIVAMVPIISIEILGVLYQLSVRRTSNKEIHIEDSEDE